MLARLEPSTTFTGAGSSADGGHRRSLSFGVCVVVNLFFIVLALSFILLGITTIRLSGMIRDLTIAHANLREFVLSSRPNTDEMTRALTRQDIILEGQAERLMALQETIQTLAELDRVGRQDQAISELGQSLTELERAGLIRRIQRGDLAKGPVEGPQATGRRREDRILEDEVVSETKEETTK